MLRPGHIRLPKDEAAEAKRAAGYARKQVKQVRNVILRYKLAEEKL
jgi:hypothetical protein